MKCIVVDDDLMARKSIERLCGRIPELTFSGSCENAGEALQLLRQQPVDLIFLDIEMPGLSGIEMLDQLSVIPQVIFTTSKTEYAYEAFEYQVTDYLKKPIDFPRFQKAVKKALTIQEQSQAYKLQAKEVYLKVDGRLIRVDFDDILFFENIGDYIKVVTEKETYIIHGTLKTIGAKLQGPQFFRVHRTFIVNLQKIKDIEENTLVIGKKVIPISRANKPGLLSKLNLL
jgi:DNA-binding LytR/AlgR family response regulator